jgi:hypothetical protein
MPGRKMLITLQVQAFVLLEEGVLLSRIIEYTGLVKSTIYRIRKIAFKRGYDPSVSHEPKDEYFTDAPRSGRPTVITEEATAGILNKVKENHEG